jgi:hypothetical protein
MSTLTSEATSKAIKVGDRVVCIDDEASFNRLRAGNQYIVEADYDGSPTVFVGRSSHSLERFERVAS